MGTRRLTKKLYTYLAPVSAMHHHHRPLSASPSSAAPPQRISQIPLLLVTLVLLFIAGFTLPGGLTPRRARQQTLASRAAEHLDVVTASSPHDVVSASPLPIEDIHMNALPHKGVWLFSFDSQLRLLLSWRAPHMKTCPMSWTPLGEHTVSNETFEATAARGLYEEARFIVRPRIHPVGNPFLFVASYDNHTVVNKSDPTLNSDVRRDVQWTQSFLILPRGDALDFRTLDDRNAQAEQAAGENSRYQGMPIATVVKHAIERPDYFCMPLLSQWILKTIPIVVKGIKQNEKRLFKSFLKEEWVQLVESGSPVCCDPSQHDLPFTQVNISMCGVACDAGTTDPSDL